MVLERYRTGWEEGLTPLALRFGRMGITPDMLTWVSLGFAILAGVSFGLATNETAWLLVAGSACVAINAILDGLDGRLARITNTATPRGDYLDHAVDRYSDVVILIGLSLSALGDVRIGLLAIVGTFLTSYMGTQAQAMGLGRNYGGWLGRADRLVLLIAVPVFTYLALLVGIDVPYGLIPLMLGWFALAGNVTAIQRFWKGWRELAERDG